MDIDLVADLPATCRSFEETSTLNCEAQQQVAESDTVNRRHRLSSQGVQAKKARFNASEAVPVQTALVNSEGVLRQSGALAVTTGKVTGRLPYDKHIVVDEISRNDIWWDGHRQMSAEAFEIFEADMLEYLQEQSLEVQDLVCGSVAEHTVNNWLN